MISREWLRHAATGVIGGTAARRAQSLIAPMRRGTPMLVLRNDGCMCCEPWADHVRERGLQVDLHESPDLDAVKARLGVPANLQSCHTGIVEGYVVEGHVPVDFILQMLEEAPEITGITVPDLPIGSPGMEGANPEPFDVVAFGPSEADRYVVGSVALG